MSVLLKINFRTSTACPGSWGWLIGRHLCAVVSRSSKSVLHIKFIKFWQDFPPWRTAIILIISMQINYGCKEILMLPYGCFVFFAMSNNYVYAKSYSNTTVVFHIGKRQAWFCTPQLSFIYFENYKTEVSLIYRQNWFQVSDVSSSHVKRCYYSVILKVVCLNCFYFVIKLLILLFVYRCKNKAKFLRRCYAWFSCCSGSWRANAFTS